MVFNLAQGQEEKRNIRSDKRERERDVNGRPTLFHRTENTTKKKSKKRK
jgi:hypothetical protein